MSEDSNYCDSRNDLFSAFLFSDLIDHYVSMNERPFYGLPIDYQNFWFFAYVRSKRMSEIVLDMTGCIDADVGAY